VPGRGCKANEKEGATKKKCRQNFETPNNSEGGKRIRKIILQESTFCNT